MRRPSSSHTLFLYVAGMMAVTGLSCARAQDVPGGIAGGGILRGMSQNSEMALAAPAEASEAFGAFWEATPLEVEEVASPPVIPRALDLTEPTDDLWDRVRNGFAMPNLIGGEVLSFQQYYQSHPEYLRRMVERSSLYLHHIVEELEKRNMPLEIVFLPMVESAYDPTALSSAHASGLWQFIPSTGRHYNLQQNWWRDERRDIVASTSAALDYLQYIYDLHGDWHLALASYNWGEGAVGRAMAKNAARDLPSDYANLALPRETRQYVPKLQALKNIFGNPRLMAELNLPSVPNQPYFHTLIITVPMDLQLAARFSGLSPQEFIALNPSHNRLLIPAQTTLVIPRDRVEQFRETLEHYEGPLASWQTHTVLSDEALEDVSGRFGIALSDLKRVNGLRGSRVEAYSGQTLLVPNGTLKTGALDFLAFLPKDVGVRKGYRAMTHRVRKGETLSGIARAYQMELSDLKTLNRLKTSRIRTGARLSVHVRERPEQRPKQTLARGGRARPDQPEKALRHTVQKGDTLFSISRRYKVGVSDLRRWNGQAGNLLRIGSTLTVWKDS